MRTLKEILGDVETYTEAPGPDGPWEWKSLRVARAHNTILVYDVDGKRANSIHIDDIAPDHLENLKEELNKTHDRTMNEL